MERYWDYHIHLCPYCLKELDRVGAHKNNNDKAINHGEGKKGMVEEGKRVRRNNGERAIMERDE